MPKPAEKQLCAHLQCGDTKDLRERIFCRLNLAPEGIARELQIEYLPEYCRALAGNAARQACVRLYTAYQPCWNRPAGEERLRCARSVLSLGSNVAEEARRCKERSGCIKALEEKVYNMVIFHLYDLEQRAETLSERGASLEKIADFETVVEIKKQAFRDARSHEEQRAIILEVRKAWRDFLQDVQKEVR